MSLLLTLKGKDSEIEKKYGLWVVQQTNDRFNRSGFETFGSIGQLKFKLVICQN